MTDLELLELAALAAGLKGTFTKTLGGYDCMVIDGLSTWAPLHDDGDAFGLAVKLNMSVSIHENLCIACARLGVVQTVRDLPTAEATRRAIVRAAAEIGKQVKE